MFSLIKTRKDFDIQICFFLFLDFICSFIHVTNNTNVDITTEKMNEKTLIDSGIYLSIIINSFDNGSIR